MSAWMPTRKTNNNNNDTTITVTVTVKLAVTITIEIAMTSTVIVTVTIILTTTTIIIIIIIIIIIVIRPPGCRRGTTCAGANYSSGVLALLKYLRTEVAVPQEVPDWYLLWYRSENIWYKIRTTRGTRLYHNINNNSQQNVLTKMFPTIPNNTIT